MALDIKVSKKKDYVYSIELKGSIDTETYQQLEKELKEIINDKTRAIIWDMEGVSYISSFGIMLMISTQKALKENHAAFTMVNLQPPIKKVLDAVRILPMLDIFDDMLEADKYIDQIIKEELGRSNT